MKSIIARRGARPPHGVHHQGPRQPPSGTPGDPVVLFFLWCSYYLSGRKTEAEKLFDTLKRKPSGEYVPPICFVYIHVIRGEKEDAIEWVKRALEEHDSFLFPFRNYFSRVLSSRSLPIDPRIGELLDPIGLP